MQIKQLVNKIIMEELAKKNTMGKNRLNEGKLEQIVHDEFDELRNALVNSIESVKLKLERDSKFQIGEKDLDKIQRIFLDYIKEFMDDNFINYFTK